MNGIPRVFRGSQSTLVADNRHQDIFRFEHRRRVYYRRARQQARTRQRVTRIR
jgi:hypothetical protein